MQLTPIKQLDRFRGVLAAQLLSSQTSGTFVINDASALGAQLVTMATGYVARVTIGNEHILLSGFSVAGDVVTCTIASGGRGYNGTTAATHASDTDVECRFNKSDVDNINNHLMRFDDDGMIIPLNGSVTTIVSATQHTIAGDYSAILTVGRAIIFKVVSTWYRGVIRDVSHSLGTTTVNISGDGLPGSGTVVSIGVDFNGNTHAPVDYQLIKQCSAAPGQNPPSGYSWLVVKGGNFFARDSSGVIRFLNKARASASSSGGVLTLDWSLANVYDCTLTENITAVTHQNGADGSSYILRIKQHASAAKTVVLGTAGGTRFSNDIASYAVTADVGAVDTLEFAYHGTDTKYDLVDVTKGFQTSPTQTAIPFTLIGTAGGTIAARDAVYVANSDGKYYACDADADESTYSFVGFAAAGASANDPVTIYLPGATMDGFSGLVTGAPQFLSGTAGAIGTTPHATRFARVAKALSATKIQILEAKFIRRGNATITATGNTTITCGFFPAVVRVRAGVVGVAASTSQISIGDDTNRCIRTTNQQVTNAYNTTKAWAAYRDTTIGSDGTIDTKTNTGFNLNCSTYNSDTELQYEVESM